MTFESFGDDDPTRVMTSRDLSRGGLPSPLPGSRPRSRRSRPGRLALAVAAAGLAFGLAPLVAPQYVTMARDAAAGAAFQAPDGAVDMSRHTDRTPAADRADAELDRASLNPISGGFVSIPATFSSADGAYDVVIHFHGLDKMVAEGFEHAGLNAVVVSVNMGIGSSAYASVFSSPSALTAILDRVQSTMERRGLRGAKLRRLALSAFSAGYGAVRGVLTQPALVARVDAVLLLDGIHAAYLPADHRLDIDRIMPFERFAELAVAGKKLFSITHSEITPNADYAGTHECTDAMLKMLQIERTQASGEPPALPMMPSLENVAKLAPLLPLTEAHRGNFHVRGYAGTQKADHVMQFAQMSETAVPDLVRHWSR